MIQKYNGGGSVDRRRKTTTKSRPSGGGGGPHRRDTGGPPGRGSTAPSRAAVESAQRANKAAKERQREREKDQKQQQQREDKQKDTDKGIDSIIKDKLSQAKDTIMRKGEHVSDPTSTTKKSWEAAGKVPAGQHKLRSQYERLKAKYGPGWEKTSQAQQLANYLSGVPVERGGGLGAQDPTYGGLTSWDQLDPDSEAYRQQLLAGITAPGAKGPASQYANTGIAALKNMNFDLARGNLTPDQYFNFRQQLMAADPSIGNVEYKKAFPWSSGSLLQGVASLAPGIGMAGRVLKGALGKAQDVGQGIAQSIPSGLMSLFNKARDVVTPAGGQGGGGGEQQFAGQPASIYPQGYGDFLLNPPPTTRPGGITTPGFPDQDGDGIDDRWQAGPGQARPGIEGIEQLPGQGVIGGMPGIFQPGYGGSIGRENEARTADFRDSDRDQIDDRDQAGPGQPHWRGSAGQGQKFTENLPRGDMPTGPINISNMRGINVPGGSIMSPMAPSALTPGSALAMSPLTHQLQFQQPNANWQQWNQNLRRFS